MQIPTGPIGSIPRPPRLIEAVARSDITDPSLDPLFEAAVRDTIERFEATGSPVITDGEQRKYENFCGAAAEPRPGRDGGLRRAPGVPTLAGAPKGNRPPRAPRDGRSSLLS